MTEWQWQVILAMIRLLMFSLGIKPYPSASAKQGDVQKLQEALDRDK